MATASQRRAATRKALAAQRQGRKAVPKNIHRAIKRGQIEQGYQWLNGTDPMPVKGTPEAKQAARLAALSRWNKIDPRFEAAFSQYYYHDDKLPDPADYDDEPENDDDEDEE